MKEDPNIDINAQTAIGFTALHYVVQNNRSGPHFWLFKELLARPDINVNVKDASEYCTFSDTTPKVSNDVGIP